jgi:alkyl sulfatase BDS1-like metallo-beta-lactamase superfamily hydrolase
VRDANAWARYLNEALDRFGPGADVVFAQHHWPVWDNHRVLDFLTKQRDLYKYLHDQTVRLMNHGWKAAEIAGAAHPAPEASRRRGTCADTTAR